MTDSAPVSRQRIDKWLFFTRLAKSRTLAQEWVEAGHVALNGDKIRRPSHTLKIGDKLEFSTGSRDCVAIVLGFALKRGPYESARLLYEDISPPKEKTTPYERILREPGSGRPEKRERRQFDRLRPKFED